MVKEWQKMLGRPEGLSDAEYAAFIKFAMGFVLDKERLWQKHSQGFHQLVLPKDRRLQVLREVHDNILFYVQNNYATLLVATHQSRHCLVFVHLPYLSTATGVTITNPACGSNAGWVII